MQIIAGKYKGKKLIVPKHITRPTMARVKESIFNSLDSKIDLSKIICLDLFAGSGSFGFEALSRGAKFVTFVDSSFLSIKTLKQNAQTLQINNEHMNFFKMNVLGFIKQTDLVDFNLIFLDPPFSLETHILNTIFEIIGNKLSIKKNILIIAELSKHKGKDLILPKSLKVIEQKSYGEPTVYFIKQTDCIQ